MLEPENNPNPRLIADPPRWLRRIMSKRVLGPQADPTVLQARRRKAEARRRRLEALGLQAVCEGTREALFVFHEQDPHM